MWSTVATYVSPGDTFLYSKKIKKEGNKIMDWSKFNYGEYVMYIFIMCVVIWFGLLTFKFMYNKEKINIFYIINSLFDVVISSLIIPFLLIGMSIVVENTNTDINKIMWLLLIILLIKMFYIKFILTLRSILARFKKHDI